MSFQLKRTRDALDAGPSQPGDDDEDDVEFSESEEESDDDAQVFGDDLIDLVTNSSAVPTTRVSVSVTRPVNTTLRPSVPRPGKNSNTSMALALAKTRATTRVKKGQELQARLSAALDQSRDKKTRWGQWLTSAIQGVDDRVWKEYRQASFELLKKYEDISEKLPPITPQHHPIRIVSSSPPLAPTKTLFTGGSNIPRSVMSSSVLPPEFQTDRPSSPIATCQVYGATPCYIPPVQLSRDWMNQNIAPMSAPAASFAGYQSGYPERSQVSHPVPYNSYLSSVPSGVPFQPPYQSGQQPLFSHPSQFQRPQQHSSAPNSMSVSPSQVVTSELQNISNVSATLNTSVSAATGFNFDTSIGKLVDGRASSPGTDLESDVAT